MTRPQRLIHRLFNLLTTASFGYNICNKHMFLVTINNLYHNEINYAGLILNKIKVKIICNKTYRSIKFQVEQ